MLVEGPDRDYWRDLEFDKDLGIEDVQYFQDIFTDKPFGFLEKEKDLSYEEAELARRQAREQYGAGGFKERQLGTELSSTMGSLGRSAGQAYGNLAAGTSRQMGQSGFAKSGTITLAKEAQQSQLFGGYAADVGSARKGYALEMDITGAEAGYAESAYDLATKGADLSLAESTYQEQQRQLDEYWDMVAMRQAAG